MLALLALAAGCTDGGRRVEPTAALPQSTSPDSFDASDSGLPPNGIPDRSEIRSQPVVDLEQARLESAAMALGCLSFGAEGSGDAALRQAQVALLEAHGYTLEAYVEQAAALTDAAASQRIVEGIQRCAQPGGEPSR